MRRETRPSREEWDKPQKKGGRRERGKRCGGGGEGLKLLSGQADSEGREKEGK